MRLSPSGRRVVYVAGYGQHPANPIVTVVLEDGTSVPLGPGHHPVWISEQAIRYSPQEDGWVRAWRVGSTSVGDAPMVAVNALTGGGNLYAGHRTDPRRVQCSWRSDIRGAVDAQLSDDGTWIAYVKPDEPHEGVSRLYVQRADGSQAARLLWEGAPTRPRFGGTTLTWEIGRGLIAGCADVANPANGAVAFPLTSEWACSHPVPVWVSGRGELLVLFIAAGFDGGYLKIATWASLRAGSPEGYDVGQSDGSAYDHDVRQVQTSGRVAVRWLDPVGLLDGRDLDLAAERIVLHAPERKAPEPIDPWELASPGTLVTDGFRWMFGDAPSVSPDGRRVCLHKNINEQEWRWLDPIDVGVFFLFDRSRYPGDVGWYLVGANGVGPLWALTRFRSGDVLPRFNGEIVEMADGRRNRWTHQNTLYALKHGGVMVQFDARFPNQDYGPEKCYERFFNTTNRARWELWYRPDTPEARALPWGDRSLDVLKQVVDPGVLPPSPSLPYIECPRLHPDDDPWAHTKPPEKPKPMLLPNDAQMVNFMRRLHIEGYAGELQRRRGIFDAPDPDATEIADPTDPSVYIDDLSIAVWTGRYVRYFSETTAGTDPHEYATRRVLTDLHNSEEARQKRGQPPPTPGPAFAGPLGVQGRDFVTP